MIGKMEAVVKFERGVGLVELREVKIPEIGSNEVLIKVKEGCVGAEARIWRDEPRGFWDRIVNPPVILGAENCGEIVEVGKEVEPWQVGDRVVSELIVSTCGRCLYCMTGSHFHCSKRILLGRGADGCFADYFKIPARFLHRIPDNVSYDEAAVAEDTSVVISALVERAGIEMGEFVVVLGPGAIGLLCSQIAKAAGASKVLVAGLSRDKERLDLAKDLGADHVVDLEKESLKDLVEELSCGEGADVVVEASGSHPAIEHAFELTRAEGKIVAIGLSSDPAGVSWSRVAGKSLKIIGNLGSRWTSWERALEMIALGRIKTTLLVTHKLPLEKWKDAFELYMKKESIKVMLTP